MESLNRSAEAITSPVGVMTAFMVFGLVGRLSSRLKRQAHWAAIAGSLLFLLFTFSPLAEALMWGLERDYRPLVNPPESAKGAYVVVLGGFGEVLPRFPITNTLSDETTGRVVEGLRLYRRIPGARILVSGGGKREGSAVVAELMAAFLRQAGVPGEDVLVEGKSRDTYENLLEVRKIVRDAEFILVTSACDFPRAMAIARRLNMRPLPAPARFWSAQHLAPEVDARRFVMGLVKASAYPSLERLGRLQWAHHEHLGYLWYRFTGRL